MKNPTNAANLAAAIVRWTARIGSLASIVVILLFVFGEGLDLRHLTARDLALFCFFPGMVALGSLLGWRWEAFGGIVVAVGLAGFYLLHRFLAGGWPRGWAFAVFALPGLLFLPAAGWRWGQNPKISARAAHDVAEKERS